MTSPQQLDMFAQLETPQPKKRPSWEAPIPPERVRPKLQLALEQARAAQTMPAQRWTVYWRTVFPQMCNWLPPEEAAQMRAAFAAEMKRLDSL